MDILMLKARALHHTPVEELMFIHRALFAAVDRATSAEPIKADGNRTATSIEQMREQASSRLPWWMKTADSQDVSA